MVDFLGGLFSNNEKKAKAADYVARAMSIGNSYNPSLADTSYGDYSYAEKNGLERTTWVFACVRAIASAQANIPMKLRQYNYVANGQEKQIARIDRLLNRRCNKHEDAWKFRYRLSGQLLLSTKGAFIETIQSEAGVITELYLLPPGQVEPLKDEKKFVKGFRITRDDGTVEVLDPERVVWIMTSPMPGNPYRQMTPLMSSRLAVETDWLAKIFNRNFLRNDGRPGMLITLNGQITPEDAQEIRNRFEGGSGTAGRTMVLEAEDIKAVDMSARPRDIQWDEALKGSKDEILAAFGVPPSMLGDAGGRCLRQSELVHLADGSTKQAKDLVGQTFDVLQPTENGIVVAKAEASWDTTTNIYRITTFSGRTLETNGKHPLFMAQVTENQRYKDRVIPRGWTPMAEIKEHFEKYDAHASNVFTEVAVPMEFPQSGSVQIDEEEARAAGELRNVVPDALFTAQKDAQAAFLSGLYSEHGRMSQHSSFDLVVPTRDYAVRLQRLLLRVNVHSIITTEKDNHLVKISHKVNMLNFLANVDIEGDNKIKADSVFSRLATKTMPGPLLAQTFGLHDGLMWDRVLSVEEIGTDKTVAVTVPVGRTYLSLFWEHNTYANSSSEIELFWETTMKAHCNAIATGLDAVTGVVGDDLYVEFDYSTVDVLQAAMRRRYDKSAQDLARGAISLDEYLEIIGRPPKNLPGSRVLIHPSGLVIGTEDDVEAVSQAYVIGQRSDAGVPGSTGLDNPFLQGSGIGNGVVGGANDQIQGELAANGGDATQTINQLAARAMRSSDVNGTDDQTSNPTANADVAERIDEMRAKAMNFNQDYSLNRKQALEAYVVGALDQWASRQVQVVTERVDHVKARKGTRHWDGEGAGTDPLDVKYIVKEDEWSNDKTVLDIVSSYATRTCGAKDEQVDQVKEILGSYMSRHTANLSGYITSLDTEGSSLDEIKSLTEQAFDDKLSRVNSNRVAQRINEIVFR